ncbi:MAG TPA: hypothetical protein VIX14_02615 [Terriglobales bacterium]
MVPTLSAFCAWNGGIFRSRPFLLFAVFWAIGGLASNWTNRTGDYSK